ncbi:hypothetical protein [Phocaeicola sp.]|uniref:hypothetical protein n=1 Tax=Phocaeicola sp. TaxID=2773926 RepID=UPI002849B987|nr:hypothetical protein [Phocaeicola sp.]MDR3794505.1 hypothetical protein [Phocaeicola sp.]
MENYIAKAADAFLTGRPYGIRLDFKRKGFVIFNHHMNLLGNGVPSNIDSLPLELFAIEDIPQEGVRIERNGDITDIYFYTDTSNPYADSHIDLEKLKAYNKYIYPLALVLNRPL